MRNTVIRSKEIALHRGVIIALGYSDGDHFVLQNKEGPVQF